MSLDLTLWHGPPSGTPRSKAVSWNFGELLSWAQRPLVYPEGVAKDDLATHVAARGWSPAVFRPCNCDGVPKEVLHRRGEHVERVTLLVLDHDEGKASVADGAELFRKYEYQGFVHTSFSSKPEAPRWRAVLTLSRPLSPDEFRQVWAFVGSWMSDKGVPIDQSAKDPSRFWYVPSVPFGGEGSYELRALEGRPLDVDRLLKALAAKRAKEAARTPLASHPRGSARYAGGALAKAAKNVQSAPKGKRNDTLNYEAFCLSRPKLGLSLETIRAELLPAAESIGLTRKEAEDTIESAWRGQKR